MSLKTYSISNDFTNGVLLSQLDYEIFQTEYVENFSGLQTAGDLVSIIGNNILNETALDELISAHEPDYTKIFIQNTIHQNKTFADDMMQRMKEQNITQGLSSIDQACWVHHRFRKTDYVLNAGPTVQIDVLNLVVSGDIETAEHVLGQMPPDDMTEDYHWLTQERINWVRNEIRSYLGWPLL